MNLTSTAFAAGAEIPKRFTCEGEDIAPPLSWSGVPAQARSLALIVDDPDAPDPARPAMTWVHWVVYNVSPTATGFAEGGIAATEGAHEGLNDWKRPGYGGPCPPVGRHRYFFKLYALDERLPDLKRPTKSALEHAMRGHVLATAELIGTYQKHGRRA